jgi:hypothetical protein
MKSSSQWGLPGQSEYTALCAVGASQSQASLACSPWRAAGRQLAHERVEALVALAGPYAAEPLLAVCAGYRVLQ